MISDCPVCGGELRVIMDDGVPFGECPNCGVRICTAPTNEGPRHVEAPEPMPEGEVMDGTIISWHNISTTLKRAVADRMIGIAESNGFPVRRGHDFRDRFGVHQVWTIDCTDAEWLAIMKEARQ